MDVPRVLYETTGPSTLTASSATGPLKSCCVVNGLLYASSTPLLGDAARRRRRSWPSRATNVFPNVIPESTPVAGGWPGAWASTSTYAWTYAWTRSWTDTDAAPTARPAPGPTPSDGWPDSRLGSLPERLAIPRATRSSRAFEPRL